MSYQPHGYPEGKTKDYLSASMWDFFSDEINIHKRCYCHYNNNNKKSIAEEKR